MTTDHSYVIQVLTNKITSNSVAKLECIRYNDPKPEIDIWDERNMKIQAAIEVLKAQR